MMRRSPVRALAGVHPPLAFHACVAPAVQLEDLVDGGHPSRCRRRRHRQCPASCPEVEAANEVTIGQQAIDESRGERVAAPTPGPTTCVTRHWMTMSS